MDRRPPFPPDFELFLASQSPRRYSLLREIGVPFTVVRSDAQEVLAGDSARHLAEGNALAKVNGAVLPARVAEGAFVLGTDTLVTVAGRVMGKPRSPREAEEMLTGLSGRTHEVVSGVALARAGASGHVGATGDVRAASTVTEVAFSLLEQADVAAYVASGEWKGKAGGYAIQGVAGLFVSGVRGEYSNVVGLPLCLLARLFRESGFDLVRRTWL